MVMLIVRKQPVNFVSIVSVTPIVSGGTLESLLLLASREGSEGGVRVHRLIDGSLTTDTNNDKYRKYITQ